MFLHGLLFIQPPPRATPSATIQPALPWAPVQPPLHGLLFIPPSTVYCSSYPSRGGPVHPAPTGSIDRGLVHPEATPQCPVHPPLHGLLFILPSTGWSCSSSPPRGPVHPAPTGNCSSNPPSLCNAHCSSRGSIDWLQLAAVAKESLNRVQLRAIDRSLGFSNA